MFDVMKDVAEGMHEVIGATVPLGTDFASESVVNILNSRKLHPFLPTMPRFSRLRQLTKIELDKEDKGVVVSLLYCLRTI